MNPPHAIHLNRARLCSNGATVSDECLVNVLSGHRAVPRGIGNTFKNDAHFATLIDDLEHKLFGRLPDETWVYPGHGGDTTLGSERPNLSEWRARGW